mmetsp:Transcript_6338/g.9761  ORF Transcript_6338/g.9761 Transcript_6338/m.9761 type:complete len:250 (-) Transcript_6338:115-864(-)
MMSHFAPSRFLIRQAIRGIRIQSCLRSPLTIKDHLLSTKPINCFQSQFFSNDSQSKQDTDDSSNASKKDETTDEEKHNPGAGVESEELADPEIARLEEEVKSLKDQLMRSLAEQENTRRIAKRDVANAKQYAIKSFSKSLLDSSDNLERALDAVPEDLRTDSENHPVLVTLYEGIKMTEAGLNKAFEMNGLKKFGAVGENFDPNMHEALFEYADPNREAGTVGQIMKSGFTLNDRVLRPAEVGVVKKEG